MSQDREDNFFNRSLERALCILNAFDTEATAFTLAQLSAKLSLPKTTILRLCSTLVKYSFLSQEQESKRYSLGLRLFELGSLVFCSFTLRQIITHFLSQSLVKRDEFLFLEFLEGEELLAVSKRGSHKRPIGADKRLGVRDIEDRPGTRLGAHETTAISRPDAITGEKIWLRDISLNGYKGRAGPGSNPKEGGQ